MTSAYLTQTVSGVVQADGTAMALVAPAVGQYWAVAAVKVGAGKQPQFNTGAQYPYCALFIGATGIYDGSTFIDDTTLGSGDISSVMSASIVIFGTQITARWQSGAPGDTVTMVIFGRSYDSLVQLQSELAPVPGTRFAGTTGNASVWTYGTIVDNAVHSFATSFPLFTVPGNAQAEVISFKYTVTTGATAINRSVGVRATFVNGADVFRVFSINVQGANGVVAYSFTQGLDNNGIGSNQWAPIPQRLILPSGAQFFSIVNSLQAAQDTWTAFTCVYRQYTSYTNVSFS